MKTKEEWINETMESLEGIQQAEPDPAISDKVLQQIQYQQPVSVSFRAPLFIKAAAIILVLISCNIITLIYFSGASKKTDNNVKSVAVEYFSYFGSINL